MAALRDEMGRKPGDPLYGQHQPRNVNEIAFDTIRDYLDAHLAPDDVCEALDGLQDRWRVGREMQQHLRERNRELERTIG